MRVFMYTSLHATLTYSDFSKSPQLMQFTGRHCKLRRSDGALLATSLSQFPILLHQHAASGNWEAAIRLCRFVKVSKTDGIIRIGYKNFTVLVQGSS